MKKLATIVAVAFMLCLAGAAPAHAAFGLQDYSVSFLDENGAPALGEAGAHPFALETEFSVNVAGEKPDEMMRDFTFDQVPGMVGNPSAVPTCPSVKFLFRENGLNGGECPLTSVVGQTELQLGSLAEEPQTFPVYNLPAPPGAPAKLGFWALSVPITVEIGVREEYPYNVVARGRGIPQTVPFFASRFTIWGNPASSAHDAERGGSVDIDVEPFITAPRSCEGPLPSFYEVKSWNTPPSVDSGFSVTTNQLGVPAGFGGCAALGFNPRIDVRPTSRSAESATGLEVNLEVDDPQLTSPTGRADSDIKEAIVTLPEGVTANPALAEGVEACSETQVDAETAASGPGEGCPQAAKIGSVEVETPLLEGEILEGELFLAEPFDNPFGSLLAVYMTVKSSQLGIGITLAGEVEPDPGTGQLVTTFGGQGTDPLPQLPFSDFRLRFREGARSPLISPPTCGTHEGKATFVPWADPSKPLTQTLSFTIDSGVAGGPCPSGGQPFDPEFEAGTENNAAGTFSPFAMRLTRRDGDQALTRFDATLPQGLVASLRGVARCSEVEIAGAKVKTGKQELAVPSCPAASRIGRLMAGAGVGSQLIYVPGSVYLAGPFAGAPLSVVAITPAVAGPFDVGNVVVRQALTLDPVTAEVKVDGSRSDPIPRILAGIPLRVRDIQVFVDRSHFTLNPTGCRRQAVTASISGFAPVVRRAPFQAADCAALPFEPRLGLRLLGGTRRGANPALRAVLRARPGDANLRRTVVKLPRSAFLDQAHIRTICTRVQWAADACPQGSIYGHVVAHTPLLDEPLRGNAYLRSSDNQLPDLVFDLKGVVDIEAAARIDSIRGGIRATFGAIPDAPISKVVVRMQGGKKGLIVNSRNLCRGTNRADLRLTAHSGGEQRLRPTVRPQCGKRTGRG
ncbi:MAG TPA: hypothetical protein VHF50_07220 [Solirubrobacterales bacterium]|nr:hypothetical protein [Solirubrobacterales bacterium]